MGLQYDRVGFWIIYGVFSIAWAWLQWGSYGTTPTGASSEVPTPMIGLFAGVLQISTYFGAMAIYFMT